MENADVVQILTQAKNSLTGEALMRWTEVAGISEMQTILSATDCPAGVLEILSENENYGVRSAVARRHDISASLRTRMIEKETNRQVLEELLQKELSEEGLLVAASNPRALGVLGIRGKYVRLGKSPKACVIVINHFIETGAKSPEYNSGERWTVLDGIPEECWPEIDPKALLAAAWVARGVAGRVDIVVELLTENPSWTALWRAAIELAQAREITDGGISPEGILTAIERLIPDGGGLGEKLKLEEEDIEALRGFGNSYGRTKVAALALGGEDTGMPLEKLAFLTREEIEENAEAIGLQMRINNSLGRRMIWRALSENPNLGGIWLGLDPLGLATNGSADDWAAGTVLAIGATPGGLRVALGDRRDKMADGSPSDGAAAAGEEYYELLNEVLAQLLWHAGEEGEEKRIWEELMETYPTSAYWQKNVRPRITGMLRDLANCHSAAMWPEKTAAALLRDIKWDRSPATAWVANQMLTSKGSVKTNLQFMRNILETEEGSIGDAVSKLHEINAPKQTRSAAEPKPAAVITF